MNPKLTRIIQFTLIFWFVFLCALHLLVQRPLWNDEAAVFLSVEAFSFKEMFTTDLLKYQVFPRAYLFVIQQFSQLFDFSLWSLRLPSFLCMITAFYLWIQMGKDLFIHRASYGCFLLSWSASMMMVYYSAELKPYSMDVLSASCALSLLLHPGRLIFLYPLFGFFSYPSFLFSFVFLYNFIVKGIQEKRECSKIILFAGILAAVSVAAYTFDMQYRNYDMVSYGYQDYFIATDSFAAFFKTWGEGMKDLCIGWLVQEPKWIRNVVSVFFTIGMIRLFTGFFLNFKKEKYQFQSVDTFVFGLFAALFILGVLKKYPFIVPRTVLFMCPLFLYLTVKGIEGFDKIHHNVYQVILGMYVVLLVFLTLWFPRLILTGGRIFQPLFS